MTAVAGLIRRLQEAGLSPRWDALAPDDVGEIAELVDVHGEDALVKAALAARAAHSVPAIYAQAWLGVWRSMPAPGPRLAVVPEVRCAEHDTEVASTCRSCAADRKQARCTEHPAEVASTCLSCTADRKAAGQTHITPHIHADVEQPEPVAAGARP